MRVTLDANIYVPPLHFGGGPMRLLEQAIDGHFEIAISEPIKSEILRGLRDKLSWTAPALREVEVLLDRCTTQFHTTQNLDVVPSDPDDNRIIECAVESASEYIITGDGDLLRIGTCLGIRIIRVSEFLRRE
jgi:putative PIN family toxin of toxin-antitoxin system